MSPQASPASVNQQLWQGGGFVDYYATRVLRPVEVMLLVRYREPLSGRVLEVGCGAGRLLGYLVELGGEVHGIDVSRAMVERCRRRYPQAQVRVGDMRELGAWEGPRLDCVFASYNVLDVLDHDQRRQLLEDLRGLLAPGGLLVFSSHNLDSVGRPPSAAGPGGGRARGLLAKLVKLLDRSPAWWARAAVRVPRRALNRRRMAALEQRRDDHAILNDHAHDYGVLHYNIRREDQQRQLSELGYELLDCLDREGRQIPDGVTSTSPELHYVARPRS